MTSLLRGQWAEGDEHDLFLIQLLPEPLDKVTRVAADNLNVEKLTIFDGGDGNGLPTFVNNIAKSAIVMLEQMKNATASISARSPKVSGWADAAELPKDPG